MKTLKIKTVLDIPYRFTGIVEWENGTKYWFQKEKIHKDDGPAAIYPDGTKFWHQNNKRHRVAGPAIEYSNGKVEYYINGIETYKEAVEVYHALFPEESPKRLSVEED